MKKTGDFRDNIVSDLIIESYNNLTKNSKIKVKDALEIILKSFQELDHSLRTLNQLALNKQISSFVLKSDKKISFNFKLQRIVYIKINMNF